MQTGFGALAQTIADSASKGNFGERLDYFNLSNNERIVVRFLTDDIITADFAGRVRTPTGKYQDFLIPDPTNNLVLRYAQEGAWDGKLVKRSAGVCVVREQLVVPQNPTDPTARPQYQVVDKIVTRDDGLKSRQFLLIKQGHNNFWDPLVGFFGIYNTIMDRDYVIMRQGEKLDTKYRIGPLDPPPNDPLRDPKVVAETYGYGRPWNKEDPERYMYCPQTAKEWADDYGSESRVKHWLVGDAQAQHQQEMSAQGAPPGWVPAAAAPPNPWDQQQAATSPPPWQQPGYTGPPPADPWATPGPPPAQPTANGLGEFDPATTSNPVPAPQNQVAPPEDQDFGALRARMKGYAQQSGQQTT